MFRVRLPRSAALGAAILALSVASCASPLPTAPKPSAQVDPLIGTWIRGEGEMVDHLVFGKDGRFTRTITEGLDRFLWEGTYNTSGKTLRITLEGYEYNNNYGRLNPKEIIIAPYELSGFNNLIVEGIPYKRKLTE